MKIIQSVLLFVLIISINCEITCSSYFETQMSYLCESISISSTQNCKYLEGDCQLSYKDCSNYMEMMILYVSQ